LIHDSDPRSVLRRQPEGGAQRSGPDRVHVPSPQSWKLHTLKPTEHSQDGNHWTTRAKNCAVKIVQTTGNYVHHFRTPWTVRIADWRPDGHQMLSGPSMAITPAGAIHTSQGVNEGWHQLRGLFCPPRADWTSQTGWLLNEDEYPRLTGLGLDPL
jgi:hypothetical protein